MLSMIPYTRREANLFRYLDDFEKSFWGGDSVKGASQFRCDISDKGDHYLLEADLPGFEKKDIAVELDGDTLTIEATHREEKDEKDKEGNYIRRERRYGSFCRSFDVSGIDTEHISADYQNGVLNLTMPKQKEVKPQTRKIELGS